jgi:hypothetical protein
MPLGSYDKFFGNKPGAAADARRRMHQTYGRKEGEHVFYAVVAKRKRKAATPRRKKR